MTEQTAEVYKLCKRGHVKSPENLNKEGKCILCRRIIDRNRRQKPKRKEWSKNFAAKVSKEFKEFREYLKNKETV